MNFDLNNRVLVGSISGLVAVGLGYFIYKNYSHYLTCGKHCTAPCGTTNSCKVAETVDKDGENCEGGTCTRKKD